LISKKKILIIGDKNSKNYLVKYLDLKNFEIIFLNTEERKIYNINFSYKILFTIIDFIFNYKKYYNKYKLSKKNFFYVITFIISNKPNLIITFDDTSNIFHTAVYNFKNINCISIQNGNRPRYTLIKNSNYGTFFSFGDYEKKLFKEKKITYKKIIPIGSVYGSNKDYKKLSKLKNCYDICLISQYNSNKIYNNKISKLQHNSILVMTEFISLICEEKKLRLCILLRENTNNEINFYNNFFKSLRKCTYIKSEKHSYEYINKSIVSIAFSSTMIKEAWVFRKKAFYMDFTRTNYFNENNQDLLLFNKVDYKKFFYFFMKIYNMNKKIYLDKIKKKSFFFMNNFVVKNPYPIINKEILNLINKE
jgi:hypothetical protein